ncbi:hypothetical protein TRIATDRAFT_299229 [Trichoderma atroviride IMI 206040]|uniref:Uncharacterized protein n=1 Tax=Hypocrea atroviridis (strain ATCC 20476 / IMI 206040) TaxID=452589 RepID=G9NRS6_HYPAI|nr:uncharacterized protein TRIATDRAFT_299229 [Trichoderma atroviride IMI 206040]EHK46708.1 hypothetical protein TRIATDRAFT_299229 [Trichoderma atroviride IMI 206040]
MHPWVLLVTSTVAAKVALIAVLTATIQVAENDYGMYSIRSVMHPSFNPYQVQGPDGIKSESQSREGTAGGLPFLTSQGSEKGSPLLT